MTVSGPERPQHRCQFEYLVAPDNRGKGKKESVDHLFSDRLLAKDRKWGFPYRANSSYNLGNTVGGWKPKNR
jgi:hypothetical protein